MKNAGGKAFARPTRIDVSLLMILFSLDVRLSENNERLTRSSEWM